MTRTPDPGLLRGRFWRNPWLTVCTLIAFAILLWLGAWQLDRREWKRALIEARAQGLAAPPVPIADVPVDWRSFEYRRVRATGRFAHGKEMRLVARPYNRRVGVQVVTPLLLAGGGAVLVNRGWAPRDWHDPAAGTGGTSAPVTVVGVLRAGGRAGWLTPDNDAARGVWHYVDVAAMAEAAGLTEVRPYVLDAVAGTPNRYPIGGQTRTDLPNNHLQYALTWFALAAALAGVYIAYHLKSR